MFQQTQIETALPYYLKFMKIYPDVFSLAKASQKELLILLQGIGYYRRFKNVLEASKIIVNEYNGIFPKTYEEIKSLPGIGAYTAGAIMSIAYNQPFAATDGNVIRVLTRVYNVSDDMRLEKNKKKIHLINQSLIEHAEPNISAQAIMEIGALICKPTNPLCIKCPLNDVCIANLNDIKSELPFTSKLPKKEVRKYICLIVHKDNFIFIRKRTEKLLEGMFEYPQYLSTSFKKVKETLLDKGVKLELKSKGQSYTHTFTHQKWIMDIYHVDLKSNPLSHWIAVTTDNLSRYPMATAHKKLKVK